MLVSCFGSGHSLAKFARLVKKVTVLLLLVFPAVAQSGTPKAFWIATGTYTAGILADDWSTQRNLSWGCPEGWNPGLYGTRPSNARFLGVSFAIEAGQAALGWKMTKARSRWWRAAGIALVGEGAADRGRAIVHNLGLTRQACQNVAAGIPARSARREFNSP